MDALSLLIACFCHDLDHRGTNNNYQVEVKSPLARLYSSKGSVNERHHLSQAICLINEQQSRILDGMSEGEFKECIDGLRELILATDLSHHFGWVNGKTLVENIITKKSLAILFSYMQNSEGSQGLDKRIYSGEQT